MTKATSTSASFNLTLTMRLWAEQDGKRAKIINSFATKKDLRFTLKLGEWTGQLTL